jgi:SAM-dependent methyltransferase
VRTGDAFGELLESYHEDGQGLEIVERDDGFISASQLGPAAYFAPLRKWLPHERQAIRFARGRVLDVGAGAGRVALHLQERGQDVVAIDNSKGAVAVMRKRGVRRPKLLGIEDIGPRLGRFDSVVLFGNNLGLLGGRTRARRLLRRLHELTPDDGRIIGSSIRVFDTDNVLHLAYHEQNRQRRRLGGQLRLRLRHGDVASPWFDYLMLPPEELEDLAAPTGWHVARVIDGPPPFYAAVLEKRRT